MPAKKTKNNTDEITEIRVERTVDGKAASKSKAAKDLTLDEARAQLRSMEARSRVKLHSDRYLWGIYVMLLVFSVVELYSASRSQVNGANVYQPLIQHVTFLFLGLCIVLVMQNIHYKYYKKLAWVLAVITLILVYYSNHHGVLANGAMRAISIKGITVQPAELAKLALVLVLARIMANNQMRHGVTNKGIILSLAMLGTFCAMLFANGLTNTLLIFTAATAMFIIGGTQMHKLLIIFTIFAATGMLVYQIRYDDKEADEGTATEMVANAAGNERNTDRTGTHKNRVSSFLKGVHPNDTIDDYNRQTMYSHMSIANGGFLGRLPGNSRESARLPLAYSDYIYAIIVEDTGFIGGVFLLIMYVLLLARAGVIAAKCTKAFPALLITGCATLIVTQAMIHMCIVVGLFPVSGQPLPFISSGGTSIIVMSAAMGMMLSVSKFAIQRTKKKQDENLALKQAVEDSGDTGVNPTMLHGDNSDPLTYTEPKPRLSASGQRGAK